MGKGGGDGTYGRPTYNSRMRLNLPPQSGTYTSDATLPPQSGSYRRTYTSDATLPPQSGSYRRTYTSDATLPPQSGTSTSYATLPPDSSASQSQNPAGSSVVVDEVPRLPGQGAELAKSGLPTPDSVLVKEVPRLPGRFPDSVSVKEVPRLPGRGFPHSVSVKEVPRLPGRFPDSVLVKEVPRLPGQATELAAKSVLLTPDSVVVEDVPNFPGQAKELATSGVPNRDSEALGDLNEGSEKALHVRLVEALLQGYRREDPERAAEASYEVMLAFSAVFLQWVRSQDYNLRRDLCEHILPNVEKAGKSSSKGNPGESSEAPYGKRTKLVESKNFRGVRKRNNGFGAEIHLPGMKNKIWLGTYKTEEAAAQAFDAADDWRATHSGNNPFNQEELDDLKERAKKAGDHLSDDRSHHNVAAPDLVENLEAKATTLASLKGKEVASKEHVSQRPPAHENFSSEEHVS